MRMIAVPGLLLFVLTAPLSAQTAEQKNETIAYLQKLQNKDGGFRADAGSEKSSLRATSAALRALKYFGGTARDVKSAGAFIARCHDATTGGFADVPDGKPDVATTAVGLMALVEAKMATEPYEAGAIKYLDANVKTFEDIRIAVAGLEAIGKISTQNSAWIDEVLKMKKKDESFGTGDAIARDTGGAMVALLRMKVGLGSREPTLKLLSAGQRPDGGFGKGGARISDLETSYRVMRCFHMLKAKPAEAAKLREFVGKCRNADGAYGVAPGAPSAVGSTYFAAIILHWLEN